MIFCQVLLTDSSLGLCHRRQIGRWTTSTPREWMAVEAKSARRPNASRSSVSAGLLDEDGQLPIRRHDLGQGEEVEPGRQDRGLDDRVLGPVQAEEVARRPSATDSTTIDVRSDRSSSSTTRISWWRPVVVEDPAADHRGRTGSGARAGGRWRPSRAGARRR